MASIARYPLGIDGAIHHWLACGPVLSPITERLAQVVKPEGTPFGEGGRWIVNYWAWHPESKDLKLRLYQQMSPFEWQPGETPTLHSPAVGGKQWQYAIAEEDQVIDFSTFNFTPTLMQGWLFAQLDVEKAMTVEAEIITIGPARLFLNGQLHTHYQAEFSYVAVQRIPVTLALNPGANDLYLHGEMFGWREARLAVGLRFHHQPLITVGLPLGELDAEQWHKADTGLANLVVKQFAFPELPGYISLHPDAPAPFRFIAQAEMPVPENIFKQLNTLKPPTGKGELTLNPGEQGELPLVREVMAGMSGMPGENSLRLTLCPANDIPLAIHREIWASKNEFSSQPYGDYESRRAEAREHLANMPYDVPAAMAALEMGKTDFIASEAVALACHFMENRYDCADFYAIGLLALLYRYGDSPALRPADKARVETAFREFKFWLDEPGIDAMCYFTENHQVLFHVAAYLAGQRWPDWTFSNSGFSGHEQRERSRGRIEGWILRRLRGNFSEWDSNAYMTLDAFAMLALTEFADDARLQTLATTLLDKIFFMIACQSFRGAHGSTHGRCYVAGLKSARVENTSSLQRIAWGMGLFNGETRATGMLALARNYRVPDVIQSIGADVNSVIVTRARSRAQFQPEYDMRDDFWDVRTLTYRAPEVMLSAAVDYFPGEMGIQEHLWQATLSPEAVVFTTYPGNSQEHGNARPNFWAGSARLPRVGMAGQTVICLYRLEPGVGLELSHAYFPTAMFDEYVIDGQWAFARQGDGYVALWGDGDLVMTDKGRHAWQELRSSGAGQAWICQVGRAADDGDFAQFMASVKTSRPLAQGLSIAWTNPQGQTLEFAWEGPLHINDDLESWDDFPHYENTYTHTPMDAEQMTIRYGGESITLDLAGD